MGSGKVDAKDIITSMETVAQFEWGAFTRWVFIILLLFSLSMVMILFYFKLKRKSSGRKSDLVEFSNALSDIPTIIKIIEKMADIQQETVYRIMGYISQNRLSTIIRRYVQGYVDFCILNINEPDKINKEFDWLIDDIANEVVEPLVFKNFIYDSDIMVMILKEIEEKIPSPYNLCKQLEASIKIGVSEAIKESKKVSFVEVLSKC